MHTLKLIAFDDEDLAVLSAHLQDAVLRVGDLAYLGRERRFAAVVNRFDWNDAGAKKSARAAYTRRQAGLRFERVFGAKITGIDLTAKDAVLSLLSIEYKASDESENPGGTITLTFSGKGAIRLEVECIEAELRDLGAAWATRRKPEHTEDETTEGR